MAWAIGCVPTPPPPWGATLCFELSGLGVYSSHLQGQSTVKAALFSTSSAHQLLFKQTGLSIGAVQDGHVPPLLPALLVKLAQGGHHTLCLCPFIGNLRHLRIVHLVILSLPDSTQGTIPQHSYFQAAKGQQMLVANTLLGIGRVSVSWW